MVHGRHCTCSRRRRGQHTATVRARARVAANVAVTVRAPRRRQQRRRRPPLGDSDELKQDCDGEARRQGGGGGACPPPPPHRSRSLARRGVVRGARYLALAALARHTASRANALRSLGMAGWLAGGRTHARTGPRDWFGARARRRERGRGRETVLGHWRMQAGVRALR